jgi:DNA-binding CsgD family transcriptional regulator
VGEDAARLGGTELDARLGAELPELEAAIGTSAGAVVARNIGAPRRFEYTVIGDPDDEAARLTDQDDAITLAPMRSCRTPTRRKRSAGSLTRPCFSAGGTPDGARDSALITASRCGVGGLASTKAICAPSRLRWRWVTARQGTRTRLLEREAQLERVDELLELALGGTGIVLAVEGAAGIGKTELLAAVRALAADRGFYVLSARGGELERDMAFGVARQLLEPAVVHSPAEQRDALLAGAAGLARGALGLGDVGAPSDPFAALHGLYWLCSNLCDRAPLLLSVDDAHWADAQSARWFSYLAQRAEGLPLAVLLAARPEEAGEARAAIDSMIANRTAESLPLAPLSAEAVATAVRAVYPNADDEFCRACHRASAGNPLLLAELLAAMRRSGIESVTGAAERVEEFASTSVARYVHNRLGRLGENAPSFARAVAVLGGGGAGAHLHQAAQLGRIDVEVAARTADDLRTADILRGEGELEFVHPLIRAAVYADIGASARSGAHATAAKILAAAGAAPERVAAHLLAADPAGDPWVVDQLRAAARRALEAGAPDSAAGLLDRALAEPPPAEQRVDVLIESGQATSRLNPNVGVERFTAALELAEGPELRGRIAIQLGKALGFSDRTDAAVSTLATVLEQLVGADPELARLVECEELMWAHFWLDDPDRGAHSRRLRAMATGLAGETTSERVALSLLAWDLLVSVTPVEQTLAAAGRALSPGPIFTDPGHGFESPTLVSAAYMYCDELDRALELFDTGIAEMRAAGWLVHLVFTYGHRAHVRLRQGALFDAQADADTGWELATTQLGPEFPGWWFAFGPYIEVLIARGQADQAVAVIESTGIGGSSPDAVIFPHPRVVRGHLHAVRGDHERAVEELMAIGALMEERGYHNPAWTPWRIHVTPSLAALGREAEAREVIDEAIVRARKVGAPLTLGAALRTAAHLETGEAALAMLEESLAILAPSQARLEHAHSLVAYGAALRRAKRRTDSREPLREGLELAHRCGAPTLEQLAREELEASGARPRSVVRTGVDALTPSERRVCQLAAEGHNNPEIAQTLFVTRRTVESHLASAYRKLDIPGRADLARALAGA